MENSYSEDVVCDGHVKDQWMGLFRLILSNYYQIYSLHVSHGSIHPSAGETSWLGRIVMYIKVFKWEEFQPIACRLQAVESNHIWSLNSGCATRLVLEAGIEKCCMASLVEKKLDGGWYHWWEAAEKREYLQKFLRILRKITLFCLLSVNS